VLIAVHALAFSILIVPPFLEDDLHDRFLDNIAAWSEVSAFGPEEDRKWGTRADIESFLKRRGNPRRLAIILDCERLFECGKETVFKKKSEGLF